MSYGKELVLDLHNADPSTFTRDRLKDYFWRVCVEIRAERAKLVFWDYQGHEEEFEKAPPHLKGVTAVQFITKSNVTVHTLHDLRKVFVNIFSCGDFETQRVAILTKVFFRASRMKIHPPMIRG